MAYVITLPCIGQKNAACVSVCPCDSIHPTPNEPGFATAEQLYIDPDCCIDCDLCARECPVQAIHPQDDVPESMREFIAKNAAYFQTK